jgi:hypothetical protein
VAVGGGDHYRLVIVGVDVLVPGQHDRKGVVRMSCFCGKLARPGERCTRAKRKTHC